jgi:hypothetical protein
LNKKWEVIYEDYDLKMQRQVGPEQFQFLELLDMEYNCGRDNEGHPKYNVELSYVDLAQVSDAAYQSAKQSCGWDNMEETPANKAMVLWEYGLKAPLFQQYGNSKNKLLRMAKAQARFLEEGDSLEAALDTQVNMIGSSAREFMQGDLNAALDRGGVMDVKPKDFLPYVMGYQDALHNRERSTDPDTSPEYFQGYDIGHRVARGERPPPYWIKH